MPRTHNIFLSEAAAELIDINVFKKVYIQTVGKIALQGTKKRVGVRTGSLRNSLKLTGGSDIDSIAITGNRYFRYPRFRHNRKTARQIFQEELQKARNQAFTTAWQAAEEAKQEDGE